MILGVHCAVILGFSAALDEAKALGCEGMQMLPYRRHHEPTTSDFESFRSAREASCVKRLIVHSRYVPNLGSSDEERRRRSVAHLTRELRYASSLGAEGYVLHAGAYPLDSGKKQGIRFITEGMAQAWRESGEAVPIILENVPGGGRRLGGTLEELAELMGSLRRTVSGAYICLDTAHAWAAGYDMATAEGMLRFLGRVHRLLDADSVRVFHLNDTRAKYGSFRENHEHWGKGFLGTEGLKVLLERSEYEEALGIIETPKGPAEDKENLAFVSNLAKQGARPR